VRLPWEVNPLFQQWLQQHFPDRAERVMARIREMGGGRDYDSRFGKRMNGEGVWAQLFAQRVQKARQRYGLTGERAPFDFSRFRRPNPAGGPVQRELF
jgi:DNA repair photolyase